MVNSFMKWAARSACALPLPLIRRLAGRPIRVDGQTLDPLVQFMVRFFAAPSKAPIPIEVVRRNTDTQGCWLTHAPDPSVRIEPWTVNGPAGLIPCEVHRPLSRIGQTDAPVLVFFHGGGHIAGSLKSHRDVCRELARQSECVIVAVDYRLAPDHRFPKGIQDALAAYDAVVQHSVSLGVDPERIGVGGDSAGANVAAVVAQSRKGAHYAPKLQILWAPWLDMSRQSRSYELFERGFFVERKDMEWYTKEYLPDVAQAFNPMASPLLGDVTGVCPSVLMVAGFDPLRDEGVAYAEKLAAGGVPTHLRVYEGLVHPFLSIAGCVPAAAVAFKESTELIKQHLVR